MAIKVALFTGLLMLMRCAAWAGSFDICYNPVDETVQGRSVTIAAPTFAGGSIPPSFAPINCDQVAAPEVGDMFLFGSKLQGLRYAGKTDIMVVTIELRIYGGDKLGLLGVMKDGIGLPFNLLTTGENGVAAGSVVTVINLDPSANAFEIIY